MTKGLVIDVCPGLYICGVGAVDRKIGFMLGREAWLIMLVATG
jgi:hypothetical protein